MSFQYGTALPLQTSPLSPVRQAVHHPCFYRKGPWWDQTRQCLRSALYKTCTYGAVRPTEHKKTCEAGDARDTAPPARAEEPGQQPTLPSLCPTRFSPHENSAARVPLWWPRAFQRQEACDVTAVTELCKTLKGLQSKTIIQYRKGGRLEFGGMIKRAWVHAGT